MLATGFNRLSNKGEWGTTLEDGTAIKTGEDIDMLAAEEYKFIGSPQDKEERFLVRLQYKLDYNDDTDSFLYQDGDDVLVSGEGELHVFDIAGRMVVNTVISGTRKISVPAKGVYIFRVTGSEIKTHKIVVR